MKKILAFVLAMALCLSCFTVFAEGEGMTIKLEASAEKVAVGDTVTVNIILDGNTSKVLNAYDVGIFYNASVLEYNASSPIAVDKVLEDAGISSIYTKVDDSVIRFAAAFTPDTLDKSPAKVEEKTVLCTLSFKAIAEGDAKLGFAIEGSAPKFSPSLPEGVMVFTDNNTEEASVTAENANVLVGEGKSVKMITEIVGIDKITVPVGTSVDEVIAKLPTDVTVKLDDGTTGTVKMTWTAGSLVSGFDGNTPGEYFFTGNITDAGEYENYNKLFSMATVVVGDGSISSDKTEIIMVIGSDAPTVNGKEVKIDVPAQILDGRTMTPSRFVAESLGADVDWDDATKTVTVTNGTKTIKLVIDSNIATIDGEEVEIDVPATIIDGRTLTPSRFVAEALGADVDWDDATKTVKVIG
ncbi:MAG: stalk domain-containing protein [Clostridia bacterium]|nr:stalk domain-containing protein [Clostridia bacterium]